MMMENREYPRQVLSVRQLTIVGMLAAVSMILGLTGYGFIPLPIAKATVMHIPVIIGAIIEGPMVGILVGLLFGLFSIFQNIVAPNILSFAFLNPLVSVVPRVLIGVTAYYCYRLPAGREIYRIGLAAAVGSLTNTIGVLGMIYLLYVADFAAARGISPDAALGAIYGIALTNGAAEAAISVIITVPIVFMIRRARGKA
ncbi:MAG TPA: ECF transporter S component [Selenomonadales bacterium]|nr:ECF transporter S component [Selenomonadales bacterium]